MPVSNSTAWKNFEKHQLAIKRSTPVDTTESLAEKAKIIERLKKDYGFFISHLFPHYAKAPTDKKMIRLANACKKNKTFKALLRAFRGYGKSVHTNIFLPLWLMIDDEMKCMLLVSDNETKACRLLASLQAELTSNQRFIHYFGVQVTFGNWEEGEFLTKSGVAFFAIGLGQSPNGTRNMQNRPDFIVLDDADTKKRCKNPMLVREAFEWVTDELMGTFDIGNERFISSNNLMHKENSIMAMMMQKFVAEKPDGQKWYDLQVNAVYYSADGVMHSSYPEKYPDAYWVNKRADTTLRSWELNYMNNPVQTGTVFKEEWIKWEEMLPLQAYDKLVVYIDPSFKNNTTSCYKAVRFWGRKDRRFDLLDCWVRIESLRAMVRYCYDLAATFPTDVTVEFYMEGGFIQTDLLDEFDTLGDELGYYLICIADEEKKDDKYARIEGTSVFYERGFIRYNIKKKNDPDFATGKAQLLAFEKGSSVPVDAPDCDHGALRILNHGYRKSKVEPVIGMRETPTSW